MVAKKYFDKHREDGTLPIELKELEGMFRLYPDRKKMDRWRNNRQGIQCKSSDGHVLFGAIDDLLVDDEGKFAVFDFKTRGFPAKEDISHYYQSQMDCYDLMLRKNGMKSSGTAYILLLHPKIFSDGNIVFASDLMKLDTNPKKAAKIFNEAVSVLEGDMPKPADDCGYCQYAKALTKMTNRPGPTF